MRRATNSSMRTIDTTLISIHALHEESDTCQHNSNSCKSIFQSTLSMRRATVQLDIFVRFLRRKPAA